MLWVRFCCVYILCCFMCVLCCLHVLCCVCLVYVCFPWCVQDMQQLLSEGQQLEEQLRQIGEYTRGNSLARFRIYHPRHSGCVVDVCMMSIHGYPVMTLVIVLACRRIKESQPHWISLFLACSLFFLDLFLFCTLSNFLSLSHFRRLNSFVWSGCRLMNSCVS